MKGNLSKLIMILGLVALLVCFVMTLLAMIGSVKLTDGCFLRYDPDAKGGNIDRITNTIMLDSTANYTVITESGPKDKDGKDTVITKYDPNHYGEWLNTNLNVSADQEIVFKVEGDISLCRAYLPKNNIQQNSDLDSNGNRIPIPRIEEDNLEPVSLIFDAGGINKKETSTNNWRNITELFANDHVIISILPDQKNNASASVKDAFLLTKVGGKFENFINRANCTQGSRIYDPICGRYSIYSGQYVDKCVWKDDYYNCKFRRYCPDGCFLGCQSHDSCFIGACCEQWLCDRCGIWDAVKGTAPEPYKDNGFFTSPWYDNVGSLFTDFNLRCSKNSDVPVNNQCRPETAIIDRGIDKAQYIGEYKLVSGVTPEEYSGPLSGTGEYQNKKYFWYSADTATALLYRKDNNELPTNPKNLGSNFQFAKISTDQSPYDNINNGRSDNGKYKIIYNDVLAGTPKTYLQYRLWSKFDDHSKNTGGYVLNIKQTKCVRKNGSSFDDVFIGRGKVQYIVVPYDGKNPNESGVNYPANDIKIDDADGNGRITVDKNGYLWMKILNKPEDYKDSYGRYKVQFFTSEKVGSFTLNILNPLFELLKGKIKNTSLTIFKNMTCYGGGVTSCTNFFNYIKAVLILYVMSYGAMFILGMVKINQQDLVIRIIKIAIVSGLMNGSTFEFFNTYIFDSITNFSDGIISNMSGYSMFSTSDKITNPFMFLESVMSKILFGKTFAGQFFALLSMGLSGLIYFILLFIAVIIVIITLLRAIAVYIMAFMAVALLIGIAPLFFTFMLFDFTRYLFDNWVRFTIRYMIEPVILMAGVIILTQLFTIYLDFATGYSVCWKCALPIKLPFPALPGLPVAFSNLEIFCINWFAPWGMDYRSGMMGINMQNYIALIIISYGMYGYVDFSGRMVAKLTNATGPSATHIGAGMSSDIENKALKEVGLDQVTRGDIKQEADARLKKRNKTLDESNKARIKANKSSKNKLGISEKASGENDTDTA